MGKKIVVIYKSHYGSTETYAKWLAEDLDAQLLRADRVKPGDLGGYDVILYGGGLYAGTVNGIGLLAKIVEVIQDKEVYLFAVGVSDMTKPEHIAAIRGVLAQKLPPALFSKLHIYHLRGGMYYSKMSVLHRVMMGMMTKMLRRKPEGERSAEEQGMLASVGKDIDFTDRATIAPLVADIKAISTQ